MDFNEFMEQPIHISKVFINGLGRTKDDFAKNISSQFFGVKNFGDYFEKAQSVQATLNGLNVTKGVRVRLDVGETPDDLVVHLNLLEQKRWAGGVTGFLGNDTDNKMGVGTGLNANGMFPNCFGSGEKISCRWQRAMTNSRRELIFQKPVGSGYLSDFSASLYNYAGQVSLSGYKENNTGISADLTIPQGDFNHKISWLGVWRQLLAIDGRTAWAVREQAGHSLKSSLRYELTYDGRDDYILPSQGHLFRLSQEIAGLGGDSSFYSKQLNVQLNKQLLKMDDRVVLQLGCSLGHIQPIDLLKRTSSKPLSIMDKFYLGGPASLRGFENKGIGPRQQDNALGADFFWQASAFLRVPLPGSVRGGFLDRFRPQVFVNCGNCMDWKSAPSMEQRLHEHIDTARLTYGVGVITNFLGARMELNYCVPVRHQAKDKIQHGFQFGISIGD